MPRPLYDALLAYHRQGFSSFHTPGHKGFLPQELLQMDLTELPQTDSLFEAGGVIAEAEQNAAAYFGAKATCFSAGGCTLAIQAMLALAVPLGGRVLCGRNLHPSAVHAMALLDIRPLWLWEQDMRVSPSQVEESLARNPDVAAVYITSPNYLGVLQDVPGIAGVCARTGAPLLVDNAHGSHLKAFGLHPLEQGASMTACSAHKTLPVLTGGAYLNIGDGRFAKEAKSAMALFGSTSPNYMIMASLDWCADWMASEGEAAFSALARRVESVACLAREKGLELPPGPRDPARLALRVASLGMTGPQAMEFFHAHRIEPEYVDREWAVFLPSPWNTREDWARLEEAVARLPQGKARTITPDIPQGRPVLTPRQALAAPGELLPLDKAEGRICKEAVYTCPPGMIAAMPGELIHKDVIKFARDYGICQIKVVK